MRRLGFFYNAHVPRADFLIAERREEVYRAIWRHLSRGKDWDLLQLCQLTEGCATLEAMPRLAARDDCRVGVWASEASPYVPLRPILGRVLRQPGDETSGESAKSIQAPQGEPGR